MANAKTVQVASALLKSRLAAPPIRTVAAADAGSIGMILHPSFGFHGSAVNGGVAIGSDDPALTAAGASAPPPVHVVGQIWQKVGDTWKSVSDPNFHHIISGVASAQSITSAAAAVPAAITSFTQDQWNALQAALNSSLHKDSGGSGNISAPAAGVRNNFIRALTATGSFSATEIAAINSSIAGAIRLSAGGSSNITAPSHGVAANIQAALHNAFSLGSSLQPVASTPITGAIPVAADTSSLTTSLLGLGSSGGGDGADTSPVPVTPAFPTTSSGPNVGLVVGLAAVAAAGIYLFAKHKHAKEHASK